MEAALLLVVLALQIYTLWRQRNMATETDLNTAEQNITDKLATLGTDMTKTIADLVAAVGTHVDIAAHITKLQTIADQLTTLDTAAKNADIPPG